MLQKLTKMNRLRYDRSEQEAVRQPTWELSNAGVVYENEGVEERRQQRGLQVG